MILDTIKKTIYFLAANMSTGRSFAARTESFGTALIVTFNEERRAGDFTADQTEDDCQNEKQDEVLLHLRLF